MSHQHRRIYLQAHHTVNLVSNQEPTKNFVSTATRGAFVVQTESGFQIRVCRQPNNMVLIEPVNVHSIVEEFSFEIGYPNWIMALVAYSAVPEEERAILGDQQLSINNNWRVTSGFVDGPRMGENQYVLNRPITNVRINDGRRPLFRIHLDQNDAEPHRIDIRIRPGHFAGMIFATNQLIQVRFNGDYIASMYRRFQFNTADDMAVHRLQNIDPDFLRLYRSFQIFRRAAICHQTNSN